MPNDRWILAAAWLLCCSAAADISAAPNARYTVDVWPNISDDDGLPQSSVIAMTQTRDGYLWLGTLKGLVRFDGIRFTVFDENNTPGLNSSQIVHLFEDSQGNLWVGTETGGAALIKDGQVKSLDIGRLTGTSEDSGGAVWLYTADGQLCRYRNGRVDVGKFGAQYFSNRRQLVQEKAGPMWVGLDWGLCGLDPTANLDPNGLPPLQQVLPVGKLDAVLASQRGGYWRLADGRVQKWKAGRLEHDFGNYPWSSGARVSATCEDREGNLIVGALNEGVFWYDADDKPARVSSAQGLSHDGVLSLCVDREGSLWVGTDGGGLNRVKRKVFDVAEAARDWVVQSVCEDNQGGLWMGFNGGGATYWKGDLIQDFGRDEGLSLNPDPRAKPNFSAVLVDRSQRVWVGTRGDGLFQLQTNRFKPVPGSQAIGRDIFAIHQDRSNRLWFGTQSGLVREHDWKVFTTREGLSTNVVRAIADDADGNLWVGTERGGLNRLRDDKFTTFRKTDTGLPSDNISSLLADADGVLWIGTGSGLARLHGNKWTRYTTREGLVSDSVGYLIEDDQGFLWIGSNAGLMRVKKQALNDFAQGVTNSILCRVYRKPDGLPSRECTFGSQPAACRTRDGRLWFPTIRGLVSVNPAQLPINTNLPPVIIESVLVAGQEQNTNSLRSGWLKAVTVPPGTEGLEIHYTSLNLAAADRARFKYRMEGHETAWTDADNDRVARYPKLPPGRYRFQVTACNEDGVWNETGSALAFMVEPPFWRTWWFLTASAVCLLGTIISVVHYFSTQKLQRQLESFRQQEALEKERSRIARDIHDQLGASLTQVSLLGELVESDKDSPGEVEAHARQISQTARDTTRTLDEIVWTVNPSNDTLDGLVTYVCKYAQEYLAVAGLRYRLDVPTQLPDITMPPEVRHNVFLASKEAVTNVVRHAKASAVCLRMRLEPDRFALEIEDNGRGPAGSDETAAQSRNGLRNMRKRMEDIGGSFTIGPGPEGGTLVRLTAPTGNAK